MAERKTVELIYDIASDVRKKLNVSSNDIDDEVVMNEIQQTVLSDVRTRNLPLAEKKAVTEGAFNSLRRELDFLEKYLDDPGISEIMVNGRNDIFVEKHGIMYRIPEYFPNDRALEEVIMRIGAGIHREINEMNPVLDARLPDGSRVHAVYKNIAINGPVLNIRRFPNKRITMNELINLGSITEEAAEFLELLVKCGYNIFLSGGTSSGKTTFLNALSDFIPSDERVIVIEDSAELQLDGIENIVRMETKNANIQGVGEITMRHLIKASLRMRPDRIIIGEVRGESRTNMKQYVVDAFTDNVFHGNQAAVCVLEQWLDEELMMNITRENNFSETAFTVKKGDKWQLRWFTPGGEIDLCGHATLGTAYVLFRFFETEKQMLVFETLSGDLVVAKKDDLLEMEFPAYELRPVEVTEEMADAIGIRPLEAYMARDLLCVLKDEMAVRELTPDLEKIKQLDGLLLHVTAKGSDEDCVSRSFAPKLAVPEDPVCGSGHCHIIPYWADKLGKDELVAFQASQRGGTLYCRKDGKKIFIAGKAALYSVDELFVEES